MTYLIIYLLIGILVQLAFGGSEIRGENILGVVLWPISVLMFIVMSLYLGFMLLIIPSMWK